MRTRSSGSVLLLVLVVLAAAGCTKKVPDLTGFTKEEAEEALKGKKLKIGQITTAKKGETPGTVVDQDPKPKAKVPDDGIVALVFEEGGNVVAGGGNTQNPNGTGSNGGATTEAEQGAVTVPDLAGKTQAEAEAALDSAGLVRGTVEVVVNDQPEGRVFFQDPPKSISVARATVVNLKLASNSTVAVPDVKNQPQAAAEQALRDAQLTVGEVRPIIAPGGVIGHVVAQNPDAGIRVAKGQPIRLEIKQDSVLVPAVVGQASKDAQLSLFNRGLTPMVRRVYRRNLPATEEEKVTSQTIPDGREVARGTQVGLVVVTSQRVIGPVWQIQRRTDFSGAASAVGGILRRREGTQK